MRGTEAPVGGIRPWIVWLAATLTFIGAGAATVFVVRHVLA